MAPKFALSASVDHSCRPGSKAGARGFAPGILGLGRARLPFMASPAAPGALLLLLWWWWLGLGPAGPVILRPGVDVIEAFWWI